MSRKTLIIFAVVLIVVLGWSAFKCGHADQDLQTIEQAPR